MPLAIDLFESAALSTTADNTLRTQAENRGERGTVTNLPDKWVFVGYATHPL